MFLARHFVHKFAHMSYTKAHFYKDNSVIFLPKCGKPIMKYYFYKSELNTLRTFANALAVGIIKFLCIPPLYNNCIWTQCTFHIPHSGSMWTHKSYSWLFPKPEKASTAGPW